VEADQDEEPKSGVQAAKQPIAAQPIAALVSGMASLTGESVTIGETF
jgi:hypothetical protein